MFNNTNTKYFFVGFLILLFVSGCSNKKDKFLNRGFHSITTKYNYLYNGYNSLNDDLEALNTQEKDNFWKLLPIEKYSSENSKENSQQLFSQAEEKATLSIQKHSMNIKGEEKNPIMDKAYLLLGKSRYYQKRYIPSLEAFNYILYKHPTSEYINHVKIWKEKINIRLGQNERAIENLKELIKDNGLESQDLVQANLFLSQAYINIKSQDSAIVCLKIARDLINDKPIRARYNYVLGQLYDKANYIDSANTLYSENISYKRKIPREFTIHSYIRKTANSDSINNSIIELEKLVDNIENTSFLGDLYHQLALLSLRQNKDSIAIKFFNSSLENIDKDDYLETENYQKLADINFDNKEYLTAGLYYDSTLIKLERKTKLYRKIKKKRDNLKDLILYENITKTNDSILKLVNMNTHARQKYFQTYIAELKIKADELKQKEQKKNDFGSQSLFDQSSSSYDEAIFYFYNPTAVAYGKNEFSKKWGKRKRVNNWRWSIKFDDIESKNSAVLGSTISKDSIYNIDYYLNKIPSDQMTIESLKSVTNDAYYKLGAIYKDQFKEFKISNQKLLKLLENNPEESLILPVKYLLYKNFMSLNDNEKAELIKEEIIKNHPKSKYAEFLLNPSNPVLAIKNNPTEIYNNIYEEYVNQNYIKTIELCDKNIKELFDTPIISKIEMLKAVAIAKEYGISNYRDQLSFIKLNYSSSIEGKEAEYILNEVLPILANPNFSDNEISNNFKIIYQFSNPIEEETIGFITHINNAIKEIKYLELETSKDYYNNIVTFVVLHGLKSYDGAMGLAEMLDKKTEIQKINSFVISSENYKTIQIHKNLEEYLK